MSTNFCVSWLFVTAAWFLCLSGVFPNLPFFVPVIKASWVGPVVVFWQMGSAMGQLDVHPWHLELVSFQSSLYVVFPQQRLNLSRPCRLVLVWGSSQGNFEQVEGLAGFRWHLVASKPAVSSNWSRKAFCELRRFHMHPVVEACPREFLWCSWCLS